MNTTQPAPPTPPVLTAERLEELKRLLENSSIEHWQWEGLKIDPEDGRVYVPECSYLSGTNIVMSADYEGDGDDCLLIQEAMKSFPILLSLAQSQQWEDISTAPKDGTSILALFADSDLPIIIRWDHAIGMDYHPCWIVCWDNHHLGKFDQLTHWMSLPTTPSKERK